MAASPTSMAQIPDDNESVPIELAWSSQRPELRDAKEDWTGVTNPAERRKLQNRLNQRARRRRKEKAALSKVIAEEATASQSTDSRDEGSNETSDIQSPESTLNYPVSKWKCTSSSPRVQSLMERFSNHAYESYIRGNPSLSHLNLLVKYNVTSALQRNVETLGMLEEYRQWEGISTFTKMLPERADWSEHTWPVNLHPTQLQRTTEHHPWVDAFPWPRFRDNLLQSFEHPNICDEDKLCHDICELANDDLKPTLVVWGPSHDPQSWEITTEFLMKWGFLLSGCTEIIQSTNYWRARRGEQPISFREVRNAMQLSISRLTNTSH